MVIFKHWKKATNGGRDTPGLDGGEEHGLGTFCILIPPLGLAYM